jgi:hypothetical protein
MAPWIGPLSVSADVVILAALIAAVTSRKVSQLARPVIASVAFACAWLMTAGLDVMQAPRWTIFLGAGVIVLSIVVITGTLHLWTQGDDGGHTGPGHRGTHDGGGPRRWRPDAPQHGGGGSAPSWWPDFERQLALYVAERERERRLPDVVPAKRETR